MKTILIKPKAIIWLIPALLIGIVFSSCKKNEDIGTIVSLGDGYVNFVNASQATGTVDFLVDNAKINESGLSYTGSTGYLPMKTGGHQVQVQSSATATSNTASLFSVTAPSYYSIFYLEDKSTLYVDDVPSPVKTGKCRVRFVNVSYALDNVDIGIKGGSKFITGLSYKAYSAYYDLDPGVNFFIYLSGTAVILKNIPVTLEAGHLYTIYFTGQLSGAVKYQVLTLD